MAHNIFYIQKYPNMQKDHLCQSYTYIEDLMEFGEKLMVDDSVTDIYVGLSGIKYIPIPAGERYRDFLVEGLETSGNFVFYSVKGSRTHSTWKRFDNYSDLYDFCSTLNSMHETYSENSNEYIQYGVIYNEQNVITFERLKELLSSSDILLGCIVDRDLKLKFINKYLEEYVEEKDMSKKVKDDIRKLLTSTALNIEKRFQDMKYKYNFFDRDTEISDILYDSGLKDQSKRKA